VKELAPKLLPDKQQEIVVYCASSTCNAAEHAARELTQMGYEDVRRYIGGKQDWIEAGLPLQGEQEQAA
jgi:rhodanese-related sulfurtransferase